MASTDAGTPAAGNGQPPPEPTPRRGLRDSLAGRIALIALVLVGALFVARTCGSNRKEISQEEAIEIAKETATFAPCPQPQCVQIRYVPQGIPVRGYWGVVLLDKLDAEGRRTQTFLVDVQTGDVTRR